MRQFFLIFLISLPLISFSCDFKEVYLGIAGPTSGAGIGGHAFIVFSKNTNNLLNSYAYQYNIFKNEDILDENIGYFGVSKEHALGFVERYRAEQRVVLLYPLKIEKQKICEMLDSIDSEMNERSINKKFDYDLLKNNCISNLLKQINNVVDKEYQMKSVGGYFDFFDPRSMIYNIPSLIISELEDHELFKDEPKIYLPVLLDEIKVNIHLENLVEKVYADSLDKNIFKQIIMKSDLRESEAFLEALYNKALESSLLKKDIQKILNFMYYISKDSDAKKRIRYYTRCLR